jgi:hypothetical protein
VPTAIQVALSLLSPSSSQLDLPPSHCLLVQGEQGLDLNTIAQKLGAGMYQRPVDMASDISALLAAGAAYPEGTERHAAARQVQAVFQGLWSQLMAPYQHL